MPRTSRLIVTNEKAVYHVMSRTALDGFPLKDIEKDFMLDLIKSYSALYFTEILGFCLMGNHFHLLVKMIPENQFTDEDIKNRFEAHYGESREFTKGQIPYLRDKLSSLSEFMREIKVGFARYYNRRHNRRYVYEAGAIGRPAKMQAKVIDDKVVAKERKKGFEINRISRFRYRTRYFTDSGIIGSKEFVAENYQRFKHLFHSKHEKKPKPIKGLDGMYSLKRLSELI